MVTGIERWKEYFNDYLTNERFSLSPYKISIIQTKPFISKNYIVTRSEGQKSITTRDIEGTDYTSNSVPEGQTL